MGEAWGGYLKVTVEWIAVMRAERSRADRVRDRDGEIDEAEIVSGGRDCPDVSVEVGLSDPEF